MIKLNHHETCVNIPSIKMRFCEAVNYSFDVPVMIKPKNIACDGALYSFGLKQESDALIKQISIESGISKPLLSNMFKDLSHLKSPIKNILLGIREETEDEIHPDLIIFHMTPKSAMELIKQYTSMFNKLPLIKPFVFLSLCANIVVNTYLSNRLCISFGCPESRKYGGVKDEHVVVGMPYEECKILFKS
jgi:uncharacterized protein (DUF169 family)